MFTSYRFSRARLLALGSAGIVANAFVASSARAAGGRAIVDTGFVKNGRVEFPPWTAATDPMQAQPPANISVSQRVGFAVVGLGRLTLEEILPAFTQSERAKVTALVTGDTSKGRLVAAQYGIPAEAVYDYANFERMRDNPHVQAVYIVLPNSMHREYVVRAARAGKHVLCEKPMATSPAECEAMIAACNEAKRMLMVAYRCRYDKVHRNLIESVRSKQYGELRMIEASNFQAMGDPNQWRLKKAMAGGGSLPDVGIYCLNAARAITGEEPIEVLARIHSPKNDPRFAEVEDAVHFMLRFPSGVVANCASGYSAHQSRALAVHTTGASFNMENAFAYRDLRLRVAHRLGDTEVNAERRIEAKNQFALEIDHMAECVQTGRKPDTPGEEGLRDHRLMQAIYHAASL